MLQVLPNGKLLVVDGQLVTECCCDCAGREPTAAFSYELLDDDPCTLQLTDDSTVNEECGEIVEWEWFRDEETTPFSTSQNPTIELEEGESVDVTLAVTDECGCRDSVVMAVHCPDWNCVPSGGACCPVSTCLCTSASRPETLTLEVSGFGGIGGTGSCAEWNGTWTLTRTTDCNYEYESGVGSAGVRFTAAIGCDFVLVGLRNNKNLAGVYQEFFAFEAELSSQDVNVDSGDCSTFHAVLNETHVDVSDSGCSNSGTQPTWVANLDIELYA